jgi:hypothetical protein
VQSAAEAPRKPHYVFPTTGAAANPLGRGARKLRVLAEAKRLAEPFGGWDVLTVVDQVRLQQAADLLLRRPGTHEDRIRYANTVRGLLGAVERRYGHRARRRPAGPFADVDLVLADDGP